MVGADETKELRQIPVKLLLGRSQEILGEEDFLEILAIRVLQNSRANQQHNGKRLLIQSFLVGTTILSFALASLIPSCKTEDQEINSVTKCWSKKSTNFLQQLAKEYPQQFYVILPVFITAQKCRLTFWPFLQQNLSLELFKFTQSGHTAGEAKTSFCSIALWVPIYLGRQEKLFNCTANC